MTVSRLLMLTAAALAASTSAGHAGPCSPEIDRMQARVDAMIAATAAAGPTGRESDAALMHRQPTPGSIAAAEERLGEGLGRSSTDDRALIRCTNSRKERIRGLLLRATVIVEARRR